MKTSELLVNYTIPMAGKTLFLLLITALIVFGGGMSALAQEQPEKRPPDREYVIGIEDGLNIQVWRSPEFTRRVDVRADGKITMPLLGDIQAANLKVSTFKSNLETLLQKYIKEPQVTITVGSSKVIRIRFSGVLSQEAMPPRGTTLLQILPDILPRLRQIQPPPNLAEMKVIGADQEEFSINGFDLLSGKAPEMNIRLLWGDDIYIPSGALPTPIPTLKPTLTSRKHATLSTQQFEGLVQQFPEADELLRSLATQPDEDTYSIDMTGLSKDQRQQLGEGLLAELEKYALSENIPPFTEITLAGINVNLAYKDPLEAFLAIPNPEPDQLPAIQRFREGELVKKGETEAEDIFLEKILDAEKTVLLRQGETIQAYPLLVSFSNVEFSGVLDLGRTKKAFLSNRQVPESKRPTKKRMFQEGDEAEPGIIVARIEDEWILLDNGQNLQLVLLRDSLNRVSSAPSSVPIPEQDVQVPGTNAIEQESSLPDSIKDALPESLQMLDPSMLNQLQTQGRDLLMSPAEIARLLVYNEYLAKISQSLDQSVSLTELLQPLFRLARERTSSNSDPVAENRAALLTLAMYVNEKSMADIVGIGGVALQPRQVRVTLLDRPDLAQHFLVSAAVTVDSDVANMVGLSKEVDDSKDESGVSFPDLTADRAGVRFAELATDDPRQAQLLQQQMSGVTREADFMPQVDRLPEGMMEAEFQQRYQDVDSAAYRMVNEEIERRIAASRIYQ